MVCRPEAETALARVLLNASATTPTQHDADGDARRNLPSSLVQEYLTVLLKKVSEDQWPSTPMLARIKRVAQALPA